MSLWSDYVKERLGWSVLEVESGFIAYHLRPPECSIEEFYVEPEQRGGLLPKRLADQVFRLAGEAGAERMWAKVTPGLPGAEHALRTNLRYGFKLAGTNGNDIILMKEIGGVDGRR